MSYDQWKTASPYDDEPDPIQEAEMWLERNPEDPTADPDHDEKAYARLVIEMLLTFIKDEI
jgi:hypothetical protein